jgi:hypothetical protein
MDVNKTLAFIEALSLGEKNPERLTTLTDSTLRLFTNIKYLARAQKETGVQFFDKKTKARRDPLAILEDLKAAYDKLPTEKAKELVIGKAFEGIDEDTRRGLRSLFSTDALSKARDFEEKIKSASGEVNRRLPDAVKNAVDQTGRLKAALREAADSFAQPFNDAVTRGIKKLLDSKKDGGLELSGKEILAGGAGVVLTGYLAKRFGGKLASRILGRLGGTAAGIAEGKVVEAATGVAPVFVTNWPPGFGGDINFPGKQAPSGQVPAPPPGPGTTPGGKVPGEGPPIPAIPRTPVFAVPLIWGTVVAALGWAEAKIDKKRKETLDKWKIDNPYLRAGATIPLRQKPNQFVYEATDEFGKPFYHSIDLSKLPEIKPQININLTVPQSGPPIASTPDKNARINIRRGKF